MRNKRTLYWIIGGGLLVIIIIYIATTYNSLVKSEEKLNEHWAEVQNTYQRRLDLVPNLVNVVKGAAGFESETLEKIAEARSKAMAGGSNIVTADNYNKERVLQDSLAAAANRLIVSIERYPTLKGTEAFSGLQTQLEGTERRIQVARSDFNETVATYNNKVRRFPSSLVAALFGFKRKDGFQADAGAEKAVKIQF